MRFGLFAVLPCLCLAWGCQNTGGSQNTQAASTRVIIGFVESVTPPGNNELLSLLGRELGCKLQPLQAIGGNAYVYNCPTTDTEESLTRKLDGLARHEDVRYAEIDRKRGIQN